MSKRSQQAIAGAVALTVPWVAAWVATHVLPRMGYEVPGYFRLSTSATVLVTGTSILGAAFLLAWAAETAEKDVPSAFAIAVLAVIAVAPEYAVDALYAWNAGALSGTPEGTEAANLAVANMTGANRILIGLGWSGIALFTIFRRGSREDPSVRKRANFLRNSVEIDREIVLEIFFLSLATLWAFLIPLNGGIDALDMAVLVGIYVAYILIILRGEVDPDEDHIGVPRYLQKLPKKQRITAVLVMFAFSGSIIFTAVEPFAHGLEDIGKGVGIPSFFMIQWVAPLASEAPELIVVLFLVKKARSTAGFNTLISSKLNQWTLLIGTLVLVYSLGLGGYGALPFDEKQAAEIWLTAAQSLFAISILINFEITVGEAITLLALFVSQVFLEFLYIHDVLVLPISNVDLLFVFSVVYVVLAGLLFVARYRDVRRLVSRSKREVEEAVSEG